MVQTMSAELPAVVRTFRVGDYTATLTIPRLRPGAVHAASCEWEPKVPERLTATEQAEYRKQMAAAMAEAWSQREKNEAH